MINKKEINKMKLYDKPVGAVICPYHENKEILRQYNIHMEQRKNELGGIFNHDDHANIAKLYGVKFRKMSDEEICELRNK